MTSTARGGFLVTSDTGRGLYGAEHLRPLLAPRSIAVIGASERAGSFGGQVLLNALGAKSLDVVAVNPRAEFVHSVRAFASVDQIDRPIDLAAICVPQHNVVEVARQVHRAGIPAALIYASGFAEVGTPEGQAAQRELADLARQGLKILGPNSLGFINGADRIEMEFIPAYGDKLLSGNLGVVAQSGALGYLLTQTQYRGIGISYWAASGNSCDVDSLDLASYMLDDPDTRCVMLVIETVKGADRIFELGRRAAAAGKPVVVYKMGDSEQGGRAAQSHTGALTGSAKVTRQAMVDAGLVVVDHFDELVCTANLFAKCGRARGSGVGVISASGGAVIISADEAETAGVPLPPLEDVTIADLKKLLPGFASAANPTDLTAEMVKNVAAFQESLRIFRRDRNLALVVMSLTAASEGITGARAPAIAEVAAEAGGAPIAMIWFSEWLDGPGAATLEAHSSIPFFRSARVAMVAIRKWLDWSSDSRPMVGERRIPEQTARIAQAAQRVNTLLAAPAAACEEGERRLDEAEGKEVLKLLGIRCAEPLVLDPARWAASWQALRALQYPVAVKVLDRRILHKARVGGVHLGLRTPEEALGAAIAMGEKLASDGVPATVIVESMVAGAAEWFVGARRDPAFGPVVTVGIGGGDVESRTPVIIVAGVDAADIEQRLAGAAGEFGRLLAQRPHVRRPLAECAAQLVALFHAAPDLTEADINPLMETDEGLVAVDAVFIASR